MKYILVLCDGMADFPVPKLNGSTPMAVALKPAMDFLAKSALIGRVKTVPDSLSPGSDTANLSAMGYDAEKCYTGRSPLEALSLGIEMEKSDVAIRLNLVTLSDDEPFEEKTMIDYSAGEISTQEAASLIDDLKKSIKSDDLNFFSGVSYRHCAILKNGTINMDLTPPHDITGKKIKEYLPKGENAIRFLELYKTAQNLLKDHPVNKKRIQDNKRPANSIWLWGQGTKPALENFYKMYGKKGAVISAVDLLKGIAKGAGMASVNVEGATGTLYTNFSNKAKAAIEVLQNGCDFVFIHLEAPDECGHQGDADGKIKAIELIDQKIVKPIFEHFSSISEPFKMLIMPDHYTPLSTQKHDRTPVPFLLYSSEENLGGGIFSEVGAEATDIYFEKAQDLTKKFLDVK